jgi:hypothetical protein
MEAGLYRDSVAFAVLKLQPRKYLMIQVVTLSNLMGILIQSMCIVRASQDKARFM